MLNLNLKDHIRGTSSFQFYRAGELWYKTDDSDFVFPVPIGDIYDATFEASIKSMLLMRYIRKYIVTLTEGVNQTVA